MSDIVRDKSMNFAIEIVNLYKFLKDEKREFVMSKQILKSGTSIGANLREAKNAQSDLDFIHKNAIAQKECDETLCKFIFTSNRSIKNNKKYYSY